MLHFKLRMKKIREKRKFKMKKRMKISVQINKTRIWFLLLDHQECKEEMKDCCGQIEGKETFKMIPRPSKER